jgi:CheY-like chemotaxis protein
LAEAARGVTPATPAEPNAVKAPPTIESVPVVGSETHNGHEANTDAQNGHAGSELNDTRQVTPATPANDSAATAPPATESIPASELAASNGHEPAEVAQNKDAGLQLQNTDTPKPSAPTLSSDAEKVPPKSDSATAAETEARDGHEAAPAPQREGVDSPIKNTSEPTPLRRSGRFDSFVAPTFANGLQAEGLRFQLLRAQLQALVSVEDFEARHEALGEFFVGLQPMVAEAEREGLHSALSVGFALENLVRKLLQHPNYTTVSALSTAAAGLGLFEELTFSKAQNRGNFSLNILVVDDDPISRRALSNALQLMFGRPDLAEGGATAVARAKEKQYDVIFLDIVMPDMDGLAACKKIRESATNKSTPILFVTSDNSAEAQDRALRSGGNGFIPKPVLPAEIALAATTFGLSGRLRQKDTAHPTEADNSKKKTQKIPVAHSY